MISQKFVTKGPINNIPVLVKIMARRRPDNKPLSETMMVRLPTHICVTQPQWVKPCLYLHFQANNYELSMDNPCLPLGNTSHVTHQAVFQAPCSDKKDVHPESVSDQWWRRCKTSLYHAKTPGHQHPQFRLHSYWIKPVLCKIVSLDSWNEK